MASLASSLLMIFFLSPLLLTTTSETKCMNFKSIISFGDSIADTGNLVGLSTPPNKLPESAFPPYGETFFHRPTGRYSDGRLIIDFIGCRDMIENALILMGEIGGNDYNFHFFYRKTIEEVKELVPLVITTISSAITELVGMGGRTFLVPGDFPLGCSVVYLTLYQTSNKEEYDPLTGCLTWLNEFSEYHNNMLQAELNRLRQIYPHVNIIYADYYNAVLRLFQEPAKFGLMDRPLPVCCGSGELYNFAFNVKCGSEGVVCCDDPSKYVNWDGIHLTETAYRWIAYGLLVGPYATPPFDWSCLGFEIKNKESLERKYSLMNS